MTSRKQMQTGKLIQQHFSDLLQKYGREWFGNTLISVTEVEMSPDLMEAKIYFSCLPDDQADKVLQTFDEMKHDVRGAIGTMVRRKLRRVPHLSFAYDSGLADGDNMNRLLKDLKNKEGRPGDEE